MEQQQHYNGYSTGGYTLDGLQRLANTDGELRDGWRETTKEIVIPDHVERCDRPTRKTSFTKHTDELKAEIRRKKKEGMKTKELAQMYGISDRGIQHILYDKPTLLAPKERKELDKDEIEWFKKHYANTSNDKLQVALGISRSKVFRLAKEYNLTKSKGYMHDVAMYASERAKESHIANGTYPKKGDGSRWAELSPERYQETRRKIKETRKKIVQDEKRRVLYGLEQKTKIKVVSMSKQKFNLRQNMKAKNKYIAIPREVNVLYYDENTKRSVKRETRAKEWGIEIKPYGE